MKFLASCKSAVTLSKQFEEMLVKLTKDKSKVFMHYQGLLENQDMKKFLLLHAEIKNLHLMWDDFMDWYFDAAQPSRTLHLMKAVANLERENSEKLLRGGSLLGKCKNN